MSLTSPSTFPVVHAETKQIYHRGDIFPNPHSAHHTATISTLENKHAIERFHKTLPEYAPTPLVSLPDLAQELGISNVYVKDESLRFGLPSFKILGASYAIHRAVCEKTLLAPTISLDEAGTAARKHGIRLVACSAGNWGRAVARMGKYLGIEAMIFLFDGVSESTRRLISGEGATVVAVNGSYDDSIKAAIEEGNKHDALLVMDTSWEGFETIPKWVVDGHSTMLAETDRQIQEACGRTPSICIVPVGVGSVAQAVVAHYRSKHPAIYNVTVEPEAAPCLMESLRNGKVTPLETGSTIMPGMNCGTVSSLGWPVLETGVQVSVAVSDAESHESVCYLTAHGINAGPCGAATLAAARKLSRANLVGQDPDAVLILFSTEGTREYVVPRST